MTAIYRAPMQPRYVPFCADVDRAYAHSVVVDCTHPVAATLTHHKGHRNISGVPASDCSTGLALNCARLGTSDTCSSSVSDALRIYEEVSCNHFDADGVLAVWTWINREDALRNEKVLRAVARIGDFREVHLPRLLPPDGPPAEALSDGVADDEDTVTTALKLACWLNTQEKARFSAPYECKDSDAKFEYFLRRLGPALERLPPSGEWQDEFDQVMDGLDAVERDGSVERRPDLGVVVVRAPRPLHYYCTFSHAVGCDCVVSVYPQRRYEVECRYTQYVNFHSRPVFPRLHMLPLARVLNALEDESSELKWSCARITDSGPILRLDDPHGKLSKKELYGHPCERRIHMSSIPPERFERAVMSFFEFGLRGVQPKVGGWGWDELHALNKRIDWPAWESTVLHEAAG